MLHGGERSGFGSSPASAGLFFCDPPGKPRPDSGKPRLPYENLENIQQFKKITMCFLKENYLSNTYKNEYSLCFI